MVPSSRRHGVRALLRRDHDRLERLFARVLDEFREGDPDDVRAIWTRFESGLAAHFDAEERYLMPLFARVDPGEASELLAEHTVFRRRLGDLGVGVDLHAVRLDVAQELVKTLREHAAREDGLLYRWADLEIDAAGRRLIERELTGAVQ
jgi:Hemerythrin HHE cation binding domain